MRWSGTGRRGGLRRCVWAGGMRWGWRWSGFEWGCLFCNFAQKGPKCRSRPFDSAEARFAQDVSVDEGSRKNNRRSFDSLRSATVAQDDRSVFNDCSISDSGAAEAVTWIGVGLGPIWLKCFLFSDDPSMAFGMASAIVRCDDGYCQAGPKEEEDAPVCSLGWRCSGA